MSGIFEIGHRYRIRVAPELEVDTEEESGYFQVDGIHKGELIGSLILGYAIHNVSIREELLEKLLIRKDDSNVYDL